MYLVHRHLRALDLPSPSSRARLTPVPDAPVSPRHVRMPLQNSPISQRCSPENLGSFLRSILGVLRPMARAALVSPEKRLFRFFRLHADESGPLLAAPCPLSCGYP